MNRSTKHTLLLAILALLLPSAANSADWKASLEFSVPNSGADTGRSRVTLTAGIDPTAKNGDITDQLDPFDVQELDLQRLETSGVDPILRAHFFTNDKNLWSDFRAGQPWPQVWTIDLESGQDPVTLRWEMTAGNQCSAYPVSLTDSSATPLSPGIVTLSSPNTLTLTVGNPATGGPPSPPASLIVSLQGRRGGLLIWSRSPEENVIGYNIYRSIVSEGDYLRLNAAPMNAQAYFDRNLSAGTAFYYRVRGVNQQGCESQDSEQAVLQMGGP